jgi:hypothetical protein
LDKTVFGAWPVVLEDGDPWTVDLLCSLNVFCCYGTVDDEVALNDRLEVLGARVPDLGLDIPSCLCLPQLIFAEAFGFGSDSRHHRELAIFGVVIVKAIGVHLEMYIDTVWLVDYEKAFAMAVVGDMEFFMDILEGENVSDGFGVKPNVTVVGDVCLHFWWREFHHCRGQSWTRGSPKRGRQACGCKIGQP